MAESNLRTFHLKCLSRWLRLLLLLEVNSPTNFPNFSHYCLEMSQTRRKFQTSQNILAYNIGNNLFSTFNEFIVSWCNPPEHRYAIIARKIVVELSNPLESSLKRLWPNCCFLFGFHGGIKSRWRLFVASASSALTFWLKNFFLGKKRVRRQADRARWSRKTRFHLRHDK